MLTAATSNFLVPNATLYVELAAFVIVLAFLAKFVVPPLNRALLQRAEKIRAEMSAAGQAMAEAEANDEERRAALEEARHHAREIVAQASQTAERVAAEAQARGQEEYDRIVASATAEVEQARQRAVDQAAERLGELVVEVVERIIGREVDAAAHQDLIDEAIQALGSSDAAAGAAGVSGSRA